MTFVAEASYRIGIDVGGTFTDFVALAADGATIAIKVPTTPLAPQDAVLSALQTFMLRVPGAHVESLAHSTTIATNALLGQMHLELPRVALLTTAGFRDVIEIGRQNRSEVYDLFVTRPTPLVRRADRLAITERLDFRGDVLTELDMSSVRAAIDYIRKEGIPAVAIGYLHSYVNPDHEQRTAREFAAALPGVYVVQSAELDPEYREYERFSTAVVNAALMPIVSRYLEALVRGVADLGINAPLYVMQSNGGMSRADRILARPATIIESGPASGVIAAAALGRRRKRSHILSFDMGGTTAKAGTIVDGHPQVVSEFEAAGRTHSGRAMKGSGYPVRFPFVDLAEVSAGGGTIAWLDDAGGLRVGPLSAGADPGPACYGNSERATVTDANVVLGRLNPTALLGGSFPIDRDRSVDAIATLASALDLTVPETAAGIIRLVDSEMSKVLRIVTVERGLDPRDFTLVAFGGNGALHACALAEELGITSVVVPQRSGLFSAYGLLVAPLQTTFVHPLMQSDDALDDHTLDDVFHTLEERARAELIAQGATPGAIRFVREFDMRYEGQSFELSIAVPERIAGAVERFHERHAATYGYRVDDERIEIVNARLTASAAVSSTPAFAPAPAASVEPAERTLWFADGEHAVPVYQRESLPEGKRIEGPAVVEQYDACTFVPSAWVAMVRDGDLELEYLRGPA